MRHVPRPDHLTELDTPIESARSRERDRRYVWHTWSPIAADRARTMIARGAGHIVWDVDGRQYIDASSLNSTCGYAHPDVAAAIHRQLMRLHGVDLSVASHQLAGLLAERLAGCLSAELSRSLFVNSGSEGLEAAVLIANGYWSNIGEQRSRVVTFDAGYHGSTVLSRSLSGLPRVGHPFRPPLPVTFVTPPVPARELRRPEALQPLLEAFANAIDGDDRPAAVIVEPFLNVGGGVVLPRGFLRGLRELCDTNGVLLILDEVFTGFGRTGRMFAYEHEGAEPDILVSSKGLCGGYVPLAAVTVRQYLYDSFRNEPVIGGLRYGHTTSGHAVACAAALATMDLMEKEQLVARAARLGAWLLDRLEPLTGTRGVVDVRGLGLLVVVEMSSPEAAGEVLTRAQDNGLLLRQAGAAVMVVPPLTIDDEGVAAIADRLERSLPAGGIDRSGIAP